MADTINGRTPEEIKKGLECCKPVWVDTHLKTCDVECPYIEDVGGFCREQLMVEALAYIQQLERERDAAVEDINEAAMTGCLCYVCSRNEKGHCKAFDHGIFEATVMCGQYEWRGPEVE